MKLRRIRAAMRRHLYEAARNPDRIADILFWPFLDVVMWGFFSRYFLHANHASLAAPAQLVGGIVLWGAFRAFQRDIAMGFLSEIWSRNLSGLFTSPISLGEYLSALMTVNLLKVGLVLGLIVLACNGLTGAPDLALSIRLLAPLALLLVFGAAVGLFVTGLMLRFSTRVQTLAYGIVGLLMPVSCVFYPLGALPAPLRAIAVLLPTTHAFEAMRSFMRTEPDELVSLLCGGAGAAVSLLAALAFFNGMVAAARRSGRLIRLD